VINRSNDKILLPFPFSRKTAWYGYLLDNRGHGSSIPGEINLKIYYARRA